QSTGEAGKKEILQQIRAEESMQKIERGGRNGQSDAQGVGRSEPKSLGQSETKGNGDDAAKRESAFSSCTGGTGAGRTEYGPANETRGPQKWAHICRSHGDCIGQRSGGAPGIHGALPRAQWWVQC